MAISDYIPSTSQSDMSSDSDALTVHPMGYQSSWDLFSDSDMMTQNPMGGASSVDAMMRDAMIGRIAQMGGPRLDGETLGLAVGVNPNTGQPITVQDTLGGMMRRQGQQELMRGISGVVAQHYAARAMERRERRKAALDAMGGPKQRPAEGYTIYGGPGDWPVEGE